MNEPWREAKPRPIPPWWRATAYALGMAAAAFSGSAVVILGMRGGVSGWSAVLLAAAVPLAGFTWALTLSILDRHPSVYRPIPDHRRNLSRHDGPEEQEARSSDNVVVLDRRAKEGDRLVQ